MKDEIMESLKKDGKFPQNLKIQKVDKFSEANIGELVVMQVKVTGIAIKLSPRLKAIMIEDDSKINLFEIGFRSKLLDVDIEFRNDYLIHHNEEEVGWEEHRNYFNRVISLFNILGIPFDFISTFDIIIFMENVGGDILETITSAKAQDKGKSYDYVELTDIELNSIIVTMNFVWTAIKESDLLELGHIYNFLGYGRYYNFHQDYLMSFINNWMFIEAMINLIWEKNMIEKGFSKKYLSDNSRNWTAQIKIDELHLMGYFDKTTKNSIQLLRQKRNKVFHVEKDEKKREILAENSAKCLSIGLKIFHDYLKLTDGDKIINFEDISNRIYNAIHKNPVSYR